MFKKIYMFLKYLKNKLSIWNNNFEVSDEDKNTLFEQTDTKIWLLANYIVVFFILLSIVVVWFDTIPEFNSKYWYEIFIVDFIISGVFLFEYIYRWNHSDEKLRFPFRFMNILDLLSFLPFFILILLYWVGSYSIFVIFRIFRVFRIFELIERLPIIKKLISWINKHKVEYLAWIFVIFIILTVFSTFAYISEQHWWNPDMFRSVPDAFWWAAVTMTTTWYWDIIPASILWKIIAWILMFLGPILIAILSSITVIIFLDSTKLIYFNKKEKICLNCWVSNPEDAKYCNKCWNKL